MSWMDSKEQLFGENRLLDALNRKPGCTLQELLLNVKSEIDTFVGEAEQFDDITMLSFDFNGKKETECI